MTTNVLNATAQKKRGPKFERIRRITGYLVGTYRPLEQCKRAEEKDRVKHGR
ncbi:MAG: hypothetical protein ACLSCV_07210 [Acutalibacteraceae bacterium]